MSVWWLASLDPLPLPHLSTPLGEFDERRRLVGWPIFHCPVRADCIEERTEQVDHSATFPSASSSANMDEKRVCSHIATELFNSSQVNHMGRTTAASQSLFVSRQALTMPINLPVTWRKLEVGTFNSNITPGLYATPPIPRTPLALRLGQSSEQGCLLPLNNVVSGKWRCVVCEGCEQWRVRKEQVVDGEGEPIEGLTRRCVGRKAFGESESRDEDLGKGCSRTGLRLRCQSNSKSQKCIKLYHYNYDSLPCVRWLCHNQLTNSPFQVILTICQV